MQIFAFDSIGRLIDAAQAEKGVDYHCPECRNRVRVKRGCCRTPHFFHSQITCNLSSKSLTHINLQYYLQQIIPDIQLEHSFLKISRRADAFWEKQGIIFEIQCSPISIQEILERTRDYASLGLKTIWILHKKIFWKRHELAHIPHYFTNFDEKGRGSIYDRLYDRGSPFYPIDLSKPRSKSASFPYLKNRQTWGIGFENDLLDSRHSEELLKKWNIEKKRAAWPFSSFFIEPLRYLAKKIIE